MEAGVLFKPTQDEREGVGDGRGAGYAQVVPERGMEGAAGEGGLTYRVPSKLGGGEGGEGGEGGLGVGERVWVPLGRGNRATPGYVLSVSDEPPEGLDDKVRLKSVLRRQVPPLSLGADLVELARWIAGYYICPLGMVFASMLPAAVKRGTGRVQRQQVALRQRADEPDASLAPPPDSFSVGVEREGEEEVKLSRLQRRVVEVLREMTGGDETQKDNRVWVDAKELADAAGARSTAPVRTLIERGVLQERSGHRVVSSLDLRAAREATHPRPAQLTPDQTRVVDDLTPHLSDGFGVHLLHGVTGSGKTEVYLRLMEAVVGRDAPRHEGTKAPSDEADTADARASSPSGLRASVPSCLLLVPEIALTPQTVARFLERFHADRVAVLHSGLTAAQRHAQWRRVRTGEADIVVGARSAVFAPLANLRLIIVDEEHDSSYKQDQLPRYHARDVAIKRGQLVGCPVVLGSATPSLESWANAGGGTSGEVAKWRSGEVVQNGEVAKRRSGEGGEQVVEEPMATARSSSSPLHHFTKSRNHHFTKSPLPPPYTLHRLTTRATGAAMPRVEIVDMAEDRRQRRGVHLLGLRLEREITAAGGGGFGDVAKWRSGEEKRSGEVAKWRSGEEERSVPHEAMFTAHSSSSSPHHHITNSPLHQIATSPNRHIATSPLHQLATSPLHQITTSPNHQDAKSPLPPPGGRIILLLNRRGYANYIACPDHTCGWMLRCDHCDATMVLHRDAGLPRGEVVRCHHCLAEQLLPERCPASGHKVTTFGLGTQRVEEELGRKFPQLRVARMDSDAMRTGRDYADTLDAFRAGELDILLGTQMIAKGLDFPSVRLVGVISGDTSLHMPDFRAAERTFQLIAQVAGRSGRIVDGEGEPGRVIVQTFNPDDPSIRDAANHDYDTFATRELTIRRETGLPPSGRMARIVARDLDHAAGYERAHTLAAALTTARTELKLDDRVRLRGPSPCPIARVADYHRHQVELIADPPAAAATLHRLLAAVRHKGLMTSDAQTAVDVDPVSLL